MAVTARLNEVHEDIGSFTLFLRRISKVAWGLTGLNLVILVQKRELLKRMFWTLVEIGHY